MINNPWDPFEEDSHTDRPGAETWYFGAQYHFADDWIVGALYGESDTEDGDTGNAKFREFNLLISYAILENLSLDAAYVTVDSTDGSEEGYDKLWMNLIYEF